MRRILQLIDCGLPLNEALWGETNDKPENFTYATASIYSSQMNWAEPRASRGWMFVANRERTMSGLAMGLVLQAALLTTGADTYDAALKTAQENGQPLVVLVGADWCPGCVTMKNSTMPAMARSGALKNVQYVMVNYDQNPALARQLMRGNSIPQLVVFSKTEKGWHREQVTGATSSGQVTGMIQRAVAAAAPVEKTPKVETKVVSDSTTPDKSSGN